MPLSAVGPRVGATEVVFRLRLARNAIRSVRLCQQVQRPRVGPPLIRQPRTSLWVGSIPRPPVDRLEYQFEVEHMDGSRERVLDPHNTRRSPGPLGDRSVVEFPGYRPPGWLDHPGPGNRRPVQIPITSEVLGVPIGLGLWATPGLDVEEPAPLLIAHDGPEYARYGDLLRFVEAMVACGRLPPMRVALLPPVDRSEHYAANANYARVLARELVPLLDWLAPQPPRRYDGRSWRVAMGTSLGAVAALHAHRRYSDLFGGLFLQSGSFYQRHIDGHERGFPQFNRIARFVSTVTNAVTARRPIPVAMTCGMAEENLANNRRMRDALTLQGYEVAFAEHRDAHNWVSWRDSLDPHLTDLLQRCWRRL